METEEWYGGYKGTETEIQGKKCAIMHGRKKIK